MTAVAGRIGKKDVTAEFKDGAVEFKCKDTVLKHVAETWFVYFQRVSKRLKTCDVIFFDGHEITEFCTGQQSIETIRDEITCPSYIGGLDPMPWKRILKDAQKNQWSPEDWQYHLEGESDGSESDSDGEWQPECAESSDDDDFSDDDEPVAKRRKVEQGQSDHDSESE